MENPRAGIPAVDCMIDKIIEGETIASVPHHSDMWNVASKPRLNESLVGPALACLLYARCPSPPSTCFEAGITDH
jgi:hypothetical protein